MTANIPDVTIAVCDSAENVSAVRAAYGAPSHVFVPSIARPDALRGMKGARSMVDLAAPQHLLEGPLPTQDSQQLLLFAQDLAAKGGKVKIILAAAGGIGYYALQLRALGLLPDTVSFERVNVKSCGLLMKEASLFPTSIDHLTAIFQEDKEIELVARTPKRVIKDKISITACITHYNRPHFLRQSLNSLLRQSRLPAAILIADDGSDSEDAVRVLAEIEKETHAVPVRILRLKHGYLGAARNQAWRAAESDYVFFMDDDDIAMPDELECLSTAAQYSGADIITCQMGYFADGTPNDMAQAPRWLPIGGSVTVGLYANLFGPANALFRRDCLKKYDGFTMDYGIGHEDWEFYARTCLNGAKFELLPLPLFWCRRRPNASMLYAANKYLDLSRNLQPYLDALPDWMQNAARLAFGQFTENEGHVGSMWQRRHERVQFWPKGEKAA